MLIWICNHCRAEIPEKEKPKACPICGQRAKGFDEGERPDPSDDDKKYTEVYEEVIKELEEYDEGCEPEILRHHCEC